MLHRSYSLLSFVRRNVNCCRTDQFYIFQIGVAKRHTSILITPKFVHVISNSSRVCYRNEETLGIRRLSFTAATRQAPKDEKETILESEKSTDKLEVDAQQKIIELNEDKLGQLKERVLSVELDVPVDKENKKETSQLDETDTKKGTRVNSYYSI